MGRRRLNCIWGYKKPVSAYVSHGHWTEKEENERERERKKERASLWSPSVLFVSLRTYKTPHVATICFVLRK